jgi:rare lipoprotein A
MVGQPYKINGHWYKPKNYSHYDKVGIASWYGDLFYGRYTANGEIFDSNRLSAANPTLPLPAYARVTNLENGRTIVVRVNDRGPYHGGRLIDLSRRAADVLGYRRQGTTRVRVTYLGPAPLDGNDSYEWRFLAAQRWAHRYAAADPRRSNPIEVGSIPQARPKPMALSAPLPPRRQPPPPPMPVAAPRMPAGGAYSIQAGSFRDPANALRARTTLGSIAGVDVAPVHVRGETYYRVRVGPFADRQAADAALAQVTAAGYHTARVVAP